MRMQNKNPERINKRKVRGTSIQRKNPSAAWVTRTSLENRGKVALIKSLVSWGRWKCRYFLRKWFQDDHWAQCHFHSCPQREAGAQESLCSVGLSNSGQLGWHMQWVDRASCKVSARLDWAIEGLLYIFSPFGPHYAEHSFSAAQQLCGEMR